MNIYVCGPIGYEAARQLYIEHKDMLEKRFPRFFLEQFKGIKKDILQLHIEPSQSVYIRKISQGGLFRALWEAGEDLKCGLCVELEQIPVRQEVTEIMEVCKESPYESASEGSFVIVAETPAEITKALKQSGYKGEDIRFTHIGSTTETAARVICFQDMVRYLTPPSRQDKDILDRKNANL